MSNNYIFFAAVCAMSLGGAFTQAWGQSRQAADHHEVNAEWKASASDAIDETQYMFAPSGTNRYTAINQQNKLGFILSPGGYEVKQILSTPSAQSFDLSFSIRSLRDGPMVADEGASAVQSDRLIYHYGGMDVEYLNSRAGMRQNFIVLQKTEHKKLRIALDIASSIPFRLRSDNSLEFYDTADDKIRMVYDGLKVWDADHQSLPAAMKLSGNTLTLEVDDHHAVYPVTVDPLSHSVEWTSSADAILPALLTNAQLQIDALYGYSSAGLGDINNDGYDDVAVGAPGAVDIVGGNTFLQAGAVFIYYGSGSGMSSTPSKVLWANTPVAGALFGFSIAAGDVVGNATNDIIIGAPLDTYSTLAATAIVGTSSVNVTAGKIYVFRGEDLVTSSPAPFAEVKLQGSSFFSNGIAGILLSNVSAKALFGFSVATADDLNNDGKADIVVGVPGYLGVNLLSVRSGAAFVYYSNNLATTTPVQLATPSSSLLGLVTLPLANTDGLLFGYSVDGAGDFNGDGFPDVVVGAPAGINLNSLGTIFSGKMLSGSAYVFYGTSSGGVGTGISPTTTTRLDPAAGGLLATAPNLFGYSVKGVRNNSYARNGRILVGAPLASVLSNVAGGLMLKAGTVSVFKTYSTGTLTPSQTISSPRGTSLLSVLSGQVINVSAMFGASMDNTMDINCDGVSDIVIGEPLSTGVGLIGVNAVGGAAIVLTGNSDGTYNTTPFDVMTTATSMDLGINAASMLGFSVAGARHTKGSSFAPRVMVGAPGKSLDFGTGLLNLGNTVATLWSFTAVNNGLGKAYQYGIGSCSILPATLLSFQGAKDGNRSLLSWSTSAEINIAEFRIARSTDGVHFLSVGKLNAAEIKKQVTGYKWVDESPEAGANYYRLEIVDKDTKVTRSGIVQIDFDKSSVAGISVQPNPVTGNTVNVHLDGFHPGLYRLTVVSAEGRTEQVQNAQVSDPATTVHIVRNHLLPGIYSVNVFDNKNKLVRTTRIVILD